VDAPDLQIKQPIPFQAPVQAFSRTERAATSLAPVSQESTKPLAYKMVDVPKDLPRIPILKVVRPAPEDHIGATTDIQ